MSIPSLLKKTHKDQGTQNWWKNEPSVYLFVTAPYFNIIYYHLSVIITDVRQNIIADKVYYTAGSKKKKNGGIILIKNYEIYLNAIICI